MSQVEPGRVSSEFYSDPTVSGLALSAEKSNQESPAGRNEDARLLEACQEFESLLVSQLLSGMRTNSLKSDFLEKGTEDEMFGGMLDQEIARTVSHQEGIGLANLLFEQLTGKSPEKTETKP